jgi:hypothetical protein
MIDRWLKNPIAALRRFLHPVPGRLKSSRFIRSVNLRSFLVGFAKGSRIRAILAHEDRGKRCGIIYGNSAFFPPHCAPHRADNEVCRSRLDPNGTRCSSGSARRFTPGHRRRPGGTNCCPVTSREMANVSVPLLFGEAALVFGHTITTQFAPRIRSHEIGGHTDPGDPAGRECQ